MSTMDSSGKWIPCMCDLTCATQTCKCLYHGDPENGTHDCDSPRSRDQLPLAIAMDAEMERPDGIWEDRGRDPASLIFEVFNDSYFQAHYSFTNEPRVVMLENPKVDETLRYNGEAHFDPKTGEACIEIVMSASPWTALHEMAHLLAWGEGHSEQWLTHYRLLVKERYGHDATSLLAWIEPPETPDNRLRFSPADNGSEG